MNFSCALWHQQYSLDWYTRKCCLKSPLLQYYRVHVSIFLWYYYGYLRMTMVTVKMLPQCISQTNKCWHVKLIWDDTHTYHHVFHASDASWLGFYAVVASSMNQFLLVSSSGLLWSQTSTVITTDTRLPIPKLWIIFSSATTTLIYCKKQIAHRQSYYNNSLN